MNSLVLSAYVAIGTPQGYILPDQDAPRHALKAVYKELGLDKDMKRLEKRYLRKEWTQYGGYVMLCVRVVNEKQVSYTWRF